MDSTVCNNHLPIALYKGGLAEEERGSCFMRVPPLGNVHARLWSVETHMPKNKKNKIK